MDYQWYKNDIDEVWIYKLSGTFHKINDEIQRHSQHYLKEPIFGINYDLNCHWGEWHPKSRQLVLAGRLLKGYEWSAVEHVMRHEMAHMIVDEIFAIDGKPHGDAWITACKVVDINPERCSSFDILKSFKGREVSPLVEKVRKLIVHGNDKAGTKEESETFLTKAQEMMIKYNIEMSAIQGRDSKHVYIKRPVGPLFKRHTSWLGVAAQFIANYYDVRCIWSYCNRKRRIEFFGTPENLDIAEYIFHSLLTTGESLWEQYYAEHKIKLKDITYRQKVGGAYDGSGRIYRKVSKNSFMKGLISGYRGKLAKEKTIVMDKVSVDDQAIIRANDGILEEAFNKEYRPSRSVSYTSTRGRGYSEGHSAGSSMTLAMGVTGGGSSGRALTA
jgi:predicted SprT family Zn-dependent metalloprotease